MTPATAPRTLPWPGTLVARPLADLAAWLRDWDPHAASLGLAAVNAVINAPDNALLARARPLVGAGPGNLAVFAHFLPLLGGRRVVVIGRYRDWTHSPGNSTSSCWSASRDRATCPTRPASTCYPPPTGCS